ncbi:MAG: hypothetical protein SW833_09360 [Cyanobacteriota bacterium]|nr:hypothetical protein [Cyanobacteriota bacterium]
MQPFQTLEVRWFKFGLIPDSTRRWFENDCPGEPIGAIEQRADLYFKTPGSDTVNLKLRSGRLELKWRSAFLGVGRWGEWEGNVERWLKWSYSDLGTDNLPLSDEGIWVKKRRSQRRYDSVACELTQLEAKGRCGWSIAFEMPETEDGDRDRFESVLRQIAQTHPSFSFNAEQSFSYVQWLQQMHILN